MVVQTIWQDLRYAARILFKQPGFTLIAVLTLALGIGINTAFFSLLNALLLKPLPIARPAELVALYTSDFSGPRYGASSYQDYLDWRERAEVLDGLLAHWRQTAYLTRGAERNEALAVDIVTGNYFDVLGVRAGLGRTFLPEEDRTPGTHPVVVVSHRAWQQRFGGDPQLVGKTLVLNNFSYTVIGIAPPEFDGLWRGLGCDLWAPLMMTTQLLPGEDALENRGARSLFVLGRLKPDVTPAQAQARFNVLAQQQRAAYPEHWTDVQGQGRVITVLPESEARIPPQVRGVALGVAGLVMTIVGLVLAVVCANLAGLLLARAVTRQREMAVRLALGATRWRLMRQLLSESLLLGLLGAVAGVFIAWWTVNLLIGLTPLVSLDLDPDRRVLLFALGAALVTGVACGLAPALQATRPNLVSALKDESGGGYRRSRLRSGLVIAQIAISALLLIGSGLFLRSLINASAVDPGFNSKNLLLLTVLLRDYKEAQGSALYQQIRERLRGLPGVRGVSTVNQPGLNFEGARRNVSIEGYTPQRGEDMEQAFNIVGPDYFQTMGTPLVRGRDFNERDVAGAPGVVIINETMARRYFPGQDALGKRLSVTGPRGAYLEIIGIARDGKYWSLGEEPRPFFSLPLLQNYQEAATLLLRTEGDPRHAIETARGELAALDRNLLITETTTMTEHLGMALLPLRIASIASAIFGLLALLLASVGVYGVVAYFVSQRTREIGVRIALGAGRADILQLVLRQILVMVLTGVTLGIAGAFALARLLASFLFGVSATDLATFVGVAVLLSLASLLAAWIPARRATNVDPLIALRYE